MLTPFGIAVRKLRLDKGLRLLDMARKLNVTESYLSAVETGRKPIPDGLAKLVAQTMALTPAETEELHQAEDRTKKEVRVGNMPEDQRALVAAFARKVDELPADFLDEIKKQLLFKSESGETPFRRKRRGLLVPPMSTQALRDLAEQVRNVFVTAETVEFPIMKVLEFDIPKIVDGFYLDIGDAEEMNGEEGRVVSNKDSVMLRNDVYQAAWRGDGRARFTACHELAHYMMHRTVSFARTREDSHPIYQDSEWQADTFAGSLLMSPRHVGRFSTPYAAATACGMTPQAAGVMLSKYAKKERAM